MKAAIADFGIRLDAPPKKATLRERVAAIALKIDRRLQKQLKSIGDNRLPGISDHDFVPKHRIGKFIEDNVNLISTAYDDTLVKLNKIFRENLGLTPDELAKLIQAETGVAASQAKFWAVDQGLKYHSDMLTERATEVGLDEYDWTDSGDVRVRDDHHDLHGKRFRFSDPPITNMTEVKRGRPERRHNPGGDYRCRCLAHIVV